MDHFSILEEVRRKSPVVHHITNWVTIYDCAQIVKSFGASPVMAHAIEEAAAMTSISSALVLNIGTLSEETISSMILSGKEANRKGIPIVLDVCGAGATAYRNSTCDKLLSSFHADIVKGNASEMSKIAGLNVVTRGVDSGVSENDLKGLVETVKTFASDYGCVAVMTGKTDIVSAGEKVFLVENGAPMMKNVVGTGCMAASVIGAFAAVSDDMALAATSALCCYGVAAEIASLESSGPIDFKNRLFDAAWGLKKSDVERLKKVAA